MPAIRHLVLAQLLLASTVVGGMVGLPPLAWGEGGAESAPQEPEDCLSCHKTVDEAVRARTVHGTAKVECLDCHADADGDPHTGVKAVTRCCDCHRAAVADARIRGKGRAPRPRLGHRHHGGERIPAVVLDVVGYRLYVQVCTNCHGDDGRGNPVANLRETPEVLDAAYLQAHDDAKLEAAVWHMMDDKKPAMPHLRHEVSETAAQAIIDFLKGLPMRGARVDSCRGLAYRSRFPWTTQSFAPAASSIG